MKFSANKACQPVYAAIHQAIKNLSKEQAIEVLGELEDNCASQIEAMEQELKEENPE